MMRALLLTLLLFAPVSAANTALLEQADVIHIVGPDTEPLTLTSEPKQTAATPVRISGWVKTRGVTGVPGRDFLVVTNLTYDETPVYWNTLIFPDTGSQPWRYYERVIRARRPIQKVDMKFTFARTGEVWFRDFKVEPIEPWDENPDAVVAMLGDSTDMISYLPREMGVGYQLQLLLSDRFHERDVQVRNLALSGDWLGRLLESGRLERELDTLARCDVMVIRYGLNDNKHAEPAVFKQQLNATCDRVLAKFPEVKIVIATTLPPRGEKFEVVTREVAAERQMPLLDIAAHFRALGEQGVWNWHRRPGADIGYDTHGDIANKDRAMKGDIHPNAFGCRLLAEALFHATEPLIAARLETKADE